MSIHWFPGHMASARKDIRATLSQVDLIIEVRDARIPASSENPLLGEFRAKKPTLVILNKSDLADSAITEAWLAALRSQPDVHALAHHRLRPDLAREVVQRARSLTESTRSAHRPLTAMIVGIPNVGKSTLINTLAGRSIAQTGNKPAVTKMQQRVAVGRDLVLLDTPGFLWPNLDPPVRGLRLALTGAISDRVVDYQDLAMFAARFLLARYPDALRDRYGLDPLPETDEGLLEAIGRRRGFLVKGGGVDLQRSSERLVHDLQDGALGPLSLDPAPEAPSEAGAP